MMDCGGKININSDTHRHRHCFQFIVTGRAAHGRIGRLFQHAISEEDEDVDDEVDAVAVAAPDIICRRRYWMDKSPYAYAAPTNANANDATVNNNYTDGEGHQHTPATTTTTTTTTTTNNDHHDRLAFLWENAPQYNTRTLRDTVSCYSHLPFGILLDDKWALARLLGSGSRRNGNGGVDGGGNDDNDDDAFDNPHLATLESHCFRGAEFVKFAKRVGLLLPSTTKTTTTSQLLLNESGNTSRENQAALAFTTAASSVTTTTTACNIPSSSAPCAMNGGVDYVVGDERQQDVVPRYQFEDLLLPPSSGSSMPPPPPPPPRNLWVIKDAMSNGAGGIWIVDETNVAIDGCTSGVDDHVVVVADRSNRFQCNDGTVFTDTTTTSSLPSSSSSSSSSPILVLHPTHRYVAQRYAWPPTLYNGRKCHVRVYALITCTGEAYIHRKAFLHVANEIFDFNGGDAENENDAHGVGGDERGGGGGTVGEGKSVGTSVFHPSVHITNCCANSHDASKFAGEICVDLKSTDDEYSRNYVGGDITPQTTLPLGEYLPSISASVASLAQSFLPFLRGGEANGGFEYLGLDFVLSSVEEAGDDDEELMAVKNTSSGTHDREIDMPLQLTATKVARKRRRPVAYLLEVNAPPSQDTATGLRHAEDLHDEVIADLLRLWVLPNVDPSWSLNRWRSRKSTPTANVDNSTIDHRSCGGWICVYPLKDSPANGGRRVIMEKNELILPSKAAILNRIRWALFEKKAMKEYELMWKSDIVCNDSNNSDDDNNNSNGRSDSSTNNDNDADNDDINSDGIGGSGCSCKHTTKDNNHGTRNSNLCNGQHHSTTSLSPSESLSELYYESLVGRWKDMVSDDHMNQFVTFARSQFPYFSDNLRIFFESGGGGQVPKVVQHAVVWSLSHRDRSVVGARLQIEARSALTSLLVHRERYSTTIAAENDPQLRTNPHLCRKLDTSFDSQMIIMGPNASSLLAEIARRMHESDMIGPGDEIIISSENHLANVTPWLNLARLVGATVKWWTVAGTTIDGTMSDHRVHIGQSSCILSDLVTDRTKVVAVSHVSNILGLERDIACICDLVYRITKGIGQVVVDGVAAAPHLLDSNATSIEQCPDWYIVSLHKLFGPHLGCMVCKRSVVQMLGSIDNDTVCGNDPTQGVAVLSDETFARSWELGTMNYEACSGAIALQKYFVTLGINAWENFCIECDGDVSSQSSNQITSESSNDHRGEADVNLPTPITRSNSFYVNMAEMYIQYVENRLLSHLVGYLQSCTPLVRIIQDVGEMKVTKDSEFNARRIPIVCFLHANISSLKIVEHCRVNGVVCRACKFLSTDRLWNEMGIEKNTEVVRFSLAHYNTLEEIDRSIQILELLDGWN